jgi:hypothetical protein
MVLTEESRSTTIEIIEDRLVTQRRLQPREAVVAAEVGDSVVLLDTESGIYFTLEPGGAQIWEMLSAGTCEDEIYRRLLAEYDVEPEELRNDISELLSVLLEKGLARIGDG